jgi:uncharacterized RDD family membrane protein YckC
VAQDVALSRRKQGFESPREHHYSKQSQKLKSETQHPCSFLRRLAAIFYDSLLLGSVFFCATFMLILFIDDGAIESGNLFYDAFLILLAYLYFCWHWVKGGQTLGMRSWYVFVVNESNTKLNWKQASLRYAASLLSLIVFGLGFVWALFDKRNKTLHDYLSKTKLIVDKKSN